MNLAASTCIKEYELTNYKNALKAGFYDFSSAKDAYRVNTTAANVGMHQECIQRYVELQALLLAVICPHWSEYVWLEVLKKPSTIQIISFPKIPAPDPSLTAALAYTRHVANNIGSTEGSMMKKAGKGKALEYDPKKDKKLTIYIATSFPEWQQKCIDLVRENLEGLTLDTKKSGHHLSSF